MTGGSRVLLAGDASARPGGLERALTRAGFLVSEAPPGQGDLEPDAIVVTLAMPGEVELRAAIAGRPESPPVIVLFAASDPDAPTAALALGADDALAAPVHLPELCARLHARIRDRQCPRSTAREGAVLRSLHSLVGEGRMTLRPDEVVLALVRRLARAFDLHGCSFLAVGPDGTETQVIAEVGPGPLPVGEEAEPERPARPAIAEAIRSRRVSTPPDGHTAVLPAVVDGRVLGVLLLQRQEGQPGLSPAQLQFAESLAEAAARALDPHHVAGNGNGVPHPLRTSAPFAEPSLDLRLQEEFERARRYSLSFSLVLLDLGPPVESDATGGKTADRLRHGLRLPDFVSRYTGGEFALVLPETGMEGARRSVARVREQLAARIGEMVEALPFSAGIVTYPHPAVTQADDLFALVEAALARGKAQLGERVGVAD